MGIWVDEKGRVVRPAEPAWTTDSKLNIGAKSIVTEGTAYLTALRDWVANGESSRFVLSDEEFGKRVKPRSHAEMEADASFKLAVYFHEKGNTAMAQKYWAKAQYLNPDDWNYHRQDWSFTPRRVRQKMARKIPKTRRPVLPQARYQAVGVSAEDVLPIRTRYREEMSCQIVHDSIHRRPGWTLTYRLEADQKPVGFGSIAVAGTWKDRPTLLEFYLVPEHRTQAFGLFETLLASAKPLRFEIQSNDVLAIIMAHTYGRDVVSEKIVFRDAETTAHPSHSAMLRRITSEAEAMRCMERRSGSSDWILELDGAPIGKGGLAFHYNHPHADVYMEIEARHRKRGFATFLVQELKRECYAMGAIPAARTSPDNVASRRTLQRAGFTPFAHIPIGSF